MLKFFRVVPVSACTLALMSPGIYGNEDQTLDAPCVVDAYLRAHEQTMQADAASDSVDAVINLVDENLVYEHPGVGIRIETANNFRQGLEAFLGATDRGRYVVNDYLVNGNTVSISMNRIFNIENDGQWEERTVNQMMVFEITDGKITRMIDYW